MIERNCRFIIHSFHSVLAATFLTAIIFQGCAYISKIHRNSASYESFTIQFAYEGLGAGPQPVSGVLILDEGTAPKVISQALVKALQQMDLSVISKMNQGCTPIMAGETWKTDTIALNALDIQAHNRQRPNMALPTDRLYGIKYEGVYEISEGELQFRIKAILYQRGAASNYRPFSSQYSGNFFVERLKIILKGILCQTSKL